MGDRGGNTLDPKVRTPYLSDHINLSSGPGFTLMLVAFSFNMVGDGKIRF